LKSNPLLFLNFDAALKSNYTNRERKQKNRRKTDKKKFKLESSQISFNNFSLKTKKTDLHRKPGFT